jgi:hypothetical protein
VLLHPPDRLLEQENAGAQYNLGNMYDFGKGVLKDAKQAASWYQKVLVQLLFDTKTQLAYRLLTPLCH